MGLGAEDGEGGAVSRPGELDVRLFTENWSRLALALLE